MGMAEVACFAAIVASEADVNDDVDLELDEFGGDFRKARVDAIRRTINDVDIVTVPPAQLAHALRESGNPLRIGRLRTRHQKSNDRPIDRRRTGAKRPRRCCAAEQQECTSFHFGLAQG